MRFLMACAKNEGFLCVLYCNVCVHLLLWRTTGFVHDGERVGGARELVMQRAPEFGLQAVARVARRFGRKRLRARPRRRAEPRLAARVFVRIREGRAHLLRAAVCFRRRRHSTNTAHDLSYRK